MSHPRSRRTLTGFRVVLLLALIAAVAVVVGLYLFGAAGTRRPGRRGAAAAPAFEEGTRMIGKDFDYTFSQGEKAVFRVRGDSIRVDKDDTVFLDSVGITLFDKEGRQFDAESDHGSINRTTNEGRLWGDVSIKGPSQLEIYSDQLLIQEKGNKLVTPGRARILYAGKYFARCDFLQASLAEEIYALFGSVRIETFPEVQPPLKLEAEQAIYERKRRQIRVVENAELHRGPAQLDADRITGLLSEDESSLTFVRALYHISGETAENEAPGTTKVSWEGDALAVMLTPKGNLVRQIDLEGTPAKPATLRSSGNGVTRTLVAPHIEGLLAEKDLLRAAEADGGVDIEEIGPPAATAASPAGRPGNRAKPDNGAAAGGLRPGADGAAGAGTPGGTAGGAAAAAPQPTVRHARGRRADATFRPDGQIATVNLQEQVTYSDGEVDATGDRAAMDMDAGRGEFFGNPVDVVSARGKMRAPHVIYTAADQLVHAVEGVRAQIEQASDAALAGSVLGEGKGPVMVQSLEAFWRRPQASFVFRGDVRAWRGDNLLLTPELTGERLAQGDQLAATSGVKTVWIPSQGEGTAGSPANPAGTGAAATGRGTAQPAAASPNPPSTPGARAGAGAGARAKGTPAAQTAASGGASSAGGAAPGKGIAGAGTPFQMRGGPITVLATNMLYRDGTGVLTYKGNVHVDQDTKTLTCDQLDVNLDEHRKAQLMTCTGKTHLDDPSTGRKIDGDSAVYRIEIRKIDVLGDPVVMHDRDGNIVHGKRLRYSIDNGKVEVLGKDDGPKPAAAAPAAALAPAEPLDPAAMVDRGGAAGGVR